MDYREKAFRDKFKEASKCLGSEQQNVVSLKMREQCVPNDVYRSLLEEIGRLRDVSVTPLQGSYQGKGYLIERQGNCMGDVILG